MSNRPLTAKQEKFCQAYIATGNYVEAVRQAYDCSRCSTITVQSHAGKLKANTLIAARIAELKGKIVEASHIDGVAILKHLAEIAMADPNELVTHRRVNCRFCHGIEHKYQWKHRGEFHYALEEWQEAKEAFDENRSVNKGRFKKPEPTEDGGYGYRRTNEPAKDCPECEGEGIDEVFIADTGKLQGPARRLYAGAKVTKNGIEIAMHSQDNARRLLGEHFGLFKTVIEAQIKSQNLNANANYDVNDPAEVAKAYAAIMNAGK